MSLQRCLAHYKTLRQEFNWIIFPFGFNNLFSLSATFYIQCFLRFFYFFIKTRFVTFLFLASSFFYIYGFCCERRYINVYIQYNILGVWGWAEPLLTGWLVFLFQEKFYMYFVMSFTLFLINAKCKAFK